MSELHAGFVAIALSAALASQVNPYLFYPQDPERQQVTCTSFVGRPDWNRAAEALMALDERHVRGVGDANGVIRYFGIYHWVADERLSTVETYDLVVRQALPDGSPEMAATGELLRIPGLTTPPSPNQARGTWILFDGFSLQGGLVSNPFSDPMPHFFGIGLPANPQWPASDGHSLFRADLLSANTGATVGENHRASAPNPTWAGLAGAPSFTTPWTYILGPFVTTPNLNIGGIDPSSTRLGATGANLSMNGLFPDCGGSPRRDGLMVRVTDRLAPFGFVFLAASRGFQFPYYTGMGLIGMSHVGNGSGSTPITVGLSVLQNGARDIPLAAPGTIPTWILGTDLVFQAVVWDGNSNLAEWTNAQAVHF